ncbi:MAG: hypothetical protein JWM58_3800 [Rhizobium sp.]|nr:hypothetical protein [Rhizobium sp.]
MQFLRFGFAIVFAALSTFNTGRAATGAADGSEIAITPLELKEYTPLKVRNKGPALAEGIVYFVDGLDSYNRSRDDYRATYPYLYGLNTKADWDVINAKFPNAERYSFRSIPRSSKYLLGRLQQLKAQGYRKIVLAGQSWGAWVTVDVARRAEATKLIDAILLTAPANYGTREFDGKPNAYFIRNKTEYLENIKAIRIPTIATFFRDDEFDPGGRGPITRDTLKANNVPALVIDNPADLPGHGAGWLPEFDQSYGACISAFLVQPKDTSCDGVNPLSTTGIASVASERQMVARGAVLISLKELSGRKFIVTSPRGHVTVEEYGLAIAKVLSDHAMYSAAMISNGDKICFASACSRIYRLSDGELIGFGSDGNWTVKMVPAD